MKRINSNDDIEIGNHVWCGLRVIIQKGVKIQDDVIIGANAFVNKSINESHCVIAGCPATIVKRNVTWNTKQKTKFSPKEAFLWKDDCVEE